MASVIINGEVKVSESRKSVTLWEDFIVEYKDGNKFERKRKWTIWFDQQTSLETGDWVEIKGELSTKVETYEKDGETKTAVGHTINNPALLQLKPNSDAPATKPRDLDDEAKYGTAPF
jgi:hypothetical protein